MADIVQAFLRTRKDLLAKLPSLNRSLTDGMVPRICYPRLTASAAGDLGLDVIWKALEPHGLQAVAQAAIDGSWSATRTRVVGQPLPPRRLDGACRRGCASREPDQNPGDAPVDRVQCPHARVRI
jgi:ribosomal protein L25 (general stress protein Ctc)